MGSPGDEEQEHGDNHTQEPVREGERTEQQQEEQRREDHEDGGDDNSGDDDAGEDDEPTLKYERIGGDIAKVIKSDLVSAFCVGAKFIVFSFFRAILLTGEGNRLT